MLSKPSCSVTTTIKKHNCDEDEIKRERKLGKKHANNWVRIGAELISIPRITIFQFSLTILLLLREIGSKNYSLFCCPVQCLLCISLIDILNFISQFLFTCLAQIRLPFSFNRKVFRWLFLLFYVSPLYNHRLFVEQISTRKRTQLIKISSLKKMYCFVVVVVFDMRLLAVFGM